MNNGSSKSSITYMAHDYIFSILQLLPIDSILSFAMTCKRFKAIASSEILWEIICTRDFGNSSNLASSSDRTIIPWKRLYQQIFHLGPASCLRLSGNDGKFPRSRASHSLNFIAECLVLFGGGCEGGSVLDDTWGAYTGNEVRRVLRWQKTNSGIPSGRFGQNCTSIGDALVLFGGINDNGTRHNDTWVGHVMHDEAHEIKLSWRLLDVGPIVPPRRGAHTGCCVGDKRMVIHGGIGLDGIRLNDTWLLDLSDGARSATWNEIITHPSPPARSGHTLTWIGDTFMILFGGRGSGYEVLNDIWLLDLGNEFPKWVELNCDLSNAPDGIPLPRVGHSATLIIGGRVLIYGGEDSYRHRKDDFWVLDPSALLKRSSGKVWKRLQVEGHTSGCRSFHGACADGSGHRVYIFGGMVDGMVRPAESSGLSFDGELYLVELVRRM